MAKRMRTVPGRIFKGRSKKGAEPAGCDDIDSRVAERNSKIQLLSSLGQVVRQRAGFSNSGQAIILDENLTARGMVESLRAQGVNARSVQEIFGRGGIPDSTIYDLSRMINARVLTRDVGRQLDGGFFDRAIVVDRRVRTPDGIMRILNEGLK